MRDRAFASTPDAMLATGSLLPTSATIDVLFESVSHWPATRWREAIGPAAETAHARARRRTSALLRDAVLTTEGLTLAAWFTADAARTVAQLLPATFSSDEQRLVCELLTDAALAILARPALPTIDLAVLLAPFLPLHLPDGA